MSHRHWVSEYFASMLSLLDADQLADVLKHCATELDKRKLPGAQLVYDVAYDLNAAESRARVKTHVERYLGGTPYTWTPEKHRRQKP